MKNRELKRIIQETAEDQGISGVMALSRIVKCKKGLSYERVSKVWHGSLTVKIKDVVDVLDCLGLKITITDKTE